jgi:hypothetical protein
MCLSSVLGPDLDLNEDHLFDISWKGGLPLSYQALNDIDVDGLKLIEMMADVVEAK